MSMGYPSHTMAFPTRFYLAHTLHPSEESSGWQYSPERGSTISRPRPRLDSKNSPSKMVLDPSIRLYRGVVVKLRALLSCIAYLQPFLVA